MINKINLPKAVIEILNLLDSYGSVGYVVGGCVRDSILDRPIHDWDICTPVVISEVQALFEEEGYKVIPTGIKHGTVTVMIDDVGYEITTFRRDGEYTDGRHPDNVEFTSNLVEDLSRRDFTMNAIAYNPAVGFIDPFEGLKDIENHTIRCVGYARDRFKEDALRILRMWRFECQLGFSTEPGTQKAAGKGIKEGLLENISKERIQSEFVKAIMSQKSNFTTRPQFFLKSIIPEWEDMIHFPQNNPYHVYTVDFHSMIAYQMVQDNGELILRLATLFHDIGKPHCYQDGSNGIRHFKGHAKVSAEMTEQILRRLKFDNYTIDNVVELIRYHDATFNVGGKYVKRWLNKIGKEQFKRLLELRKADIKAHNPRYIDDRLDKIREIEMILENILKEEQCFSIKDLAINGKDVMKWACIKEGKDVGIWLNRLLKLVIDGELPNDKDTLIYYIIGTTDGWMKP